MDEGSIPSSSTVEMLAFQLAIVTGTGIPLRFKPGGLKVRILPVAPSTLGGNGIRARFRPSFPSGYSGFESLGVYETRNGFWRWATRCFRN